MNAAATARFVAVTSCAVLLASCSWFGARSSQVPARRPPAPLASTTAAGSAAPEADLPDSRSAPVSSSQAEGTGADSVVTGGGTEGTTAGSAETGPGSLVTATSSAITVTTAAAPAGAVTRAAPPATDGQAIGFDTLGDSTVPAAESIGTLAYGILAAADPYRITISPTERDCLTRAGAALSDEQLDAALSWTEPDGGFAEPVNGCLTPSNREAFATWHMIDGRLADVDDVHYHCVEEHLVTVTRDSLRQAIATCGVAG
jgi:hypothetical protein